MGRRDLQPHPHRSRTTRQPERAAPTRTHRARAQPHDPTPRLLLRAPLRRRPLAHPEHRPRGRGIQVHHRRLKAAPPERRRTLPLRAGQHRRRTDHHRAAIRADHMPVQPIAVHRGQGREHARAARATGDHRSERPVRHAPAAASPVLRPRRPQQHLRTATLPRRLRPIPDHRRADQQPPPRPEPRHLLLLARRHARRHHPRRRPRCPRTAEQSPHQLHQLPRQRTEIPLPRLRATFLLPLGDRPPHPDPQGRPDLVPDPPHPRRINPWTAT